MMEEHLAATAAPSTVLPTPLSCGALKVMSFNLADFNDAPQWPVVADRKKHVLDLVQQHKPHVLCLQESMFLEFELEHLGLFAPRKVKRTTTHGGECQIFTSLPIVSEAQTEPDCGSCHYGFQIIAIDVSSLLEGAKGCDDAAATPASRPSTMAFSSMHLAPDAKNGLVRRNQLDRIMTTTLTNMWITHSLVVVGDSNMRRDEACDAMGLKDGYLSFKQHQQRTAPMRSPLLTSPSVEDTTDPAAATHIVVDGNVVALDSLLDNAGLRKHLSADGPSMTLPRFCRIRHERRLTASHTRLSCLDLHLKDEDAEPPEPSMVLSHLYPEDEFTCDRIRNKFNGLQSAGYRTRYDRLLLAKELLEPTTTITTTVGDSSTVCTPVTQSATATNVVGCTTPPPPNPAMFATPEHQSCSKIEAGEFPLPATDNASLQGPLKVDVVGWQLIGDEPYPAPDCEPGLLDMASATMDLDATEEDLRKLYYLSDHFGFVADLQLSLR